MIYISMNKELNSLVNTVLNNISDNIEDGFVESPTRITPTNEQGGELVNVVGFNKGMRWTILTYYSLSEDESYLKVGFHKFRHTETDWIRIDVELFMRMENLKRAIIGCQHVTGESDLTMSGLKAMKRNKKKLAKIAKRMPK